MVRSETLMGIAMIMLLLFVDFMILLLIIEGIQKSSEGQVIIGLFLGIICNLILIGFTMEIFK